MRAGLWRRGYGRARQRGSMAIEMVLLTPVLVMFILLIVAGGRLVGRHGDIDSAARDGARAASIERTRSSAVDTGAAVARASLASLFPDGTTCQPAEVDWNQGESAVKVTIRCQVSFSGLGLIGLPGSVPIEGDSVAPLDQYRRTG